MASLLGSPDIAARAANLSTPHVADACLRRKAPYHVAPAALRPVSLGMKAAGRVLPCRHFGSVDVFFEAMDRAKPGDILVIDNGGRLDEGCIGDLTVLEARAFGIAGVLVWGSIRDTAELRQIGLPVWSLGVVPTGPRRLDPRTANALEEARVGDVTVDARWAAFADDDGIVFAPLDGLEAVLDAALRIATRERAQADGVRAGKTMHAQFRFAEYVAARATNPSLTFREHLRTVGGAIEE